MEVLSWVYLHKTLGEITTLAGHSCRAPSRSQSTALHAAPPRNSGGGNGVRKLETRVGV